MEGIKIDEFIKKYKAHNNRDPTVEEIYDNLEDNIEKKHIDMFIGKMKNKTLNIISPNRRKSQPKSPTIDPNIV